MDKANIAKQEGFLEEDKRIDRFLKYYTLIVVLLIFISYINILPSNFQQIVTERIPGVSGILIPVTDEYFKVVIAINNFQLLIAAITAFLSFIFIIWRRNLYEVLGILALGMLPRERKVWGVVREKNNFTTIPFAQIRLLKDDNGSKIQENQAVADLDGRYRIQIKDKSSKYFLEVKATGFKQYNKEINFINTLITSDLIIDDILLEEEFIQKTSLKSKFNELRPRFYTFLIWFIFISYLVNIPIAVFATINNPILINWLFSVTVVITTVWNINVMKTRFRPDHGRVVNSENKPILNLTVDIYDNSGKLDSARTNDKGIIKFDVHPGNYLIRPLIENGNNVFLPVRIDTRGFLENNIQLKNLSDGNKISLINPFGNIS